MRHVAAIAFIGALAVPLRQANAQEIDTDHLFAFSQGTDIGEVGTTEFESSSDGRFGKRGGDYSAYSQEFELGYIAAKNLHLFAGGSAAYFDISKVPELDNRRRLSFQELEIEARYRLMDRATSPFGLALQVQPGWGTVEETSGKRAASYGAAFSILADKEIVKNSIVAAINVTYEPEAIRENGTWERESALSLTGAALAQVRPDFFIGLGVQHLRKYEGLGLNRLAGQATFVGPNLCWSPKGFWLIAGWSAQVAGDANGSSNSLDLVNFERHRARLSIGFAL